MERRSGREGAKPKLGEVLGQELAGKLMDAGNLVFGGLVVAQLLASGSFDWRLAVVGLMLWLLLFGIGAGLLYWGAREEH